MQAYPTTEKLAEAIKKKVGSSAPKSLSRLKRVILKERANKEHESAHTEVQRAQEGLDRAILAGKSMQSNLQVVKQVLDSGWLTLISLMDL